MSNTVFGEAFKKVGINTAQAQFYVACVDALRRASGNAIRAAQDETLREAMVRYLYEVARDMDGTARRRDGVSQQENEASHGHLDHPIPAPNGDGASHPKIVSPKGHDRAAASLSPRGDKPREPSPTGTGGHPGVAPAPVAPRTTISKTAAARVARAQSVFDREIGGGIKARGSTKRDWITVNRKGVMMGHVSDRILSEVPWPDEDNTTLETLISESEYQAILNSGYGVLDAMGAGNGTL